MGSLLASGICYGSAQMVDSTWSWRIPSLIQAGPSIFAIIVLFFLPESPRWLAYNDRNEEALQVLAKLHGGSTDDAVVQVQYREIMDTLEFEKSAGKSLSPTEVFKTPSNRKRLALATSIAPLTMLTGSNIITLVPPEYCIMVVAYPVKASTSVIC